MEIKYRVTFSNGMAESPYYNNFMDAVRYGWTYTYEFFVWRYVEYADSRQDTKKLVAHIHYDGIK